MFKPEFFNISLHSVREIKGLDTIHNNEILGHSVALEIKDMYVSFCRHKRSKGALLSFFTWETAVTEATASQSALFIVSFYLMVNTQAQEPTVHFKLTDLIDEVYI